MTVLLKTVMMVGGEIPRQGHPRPRTNITALELVANRPILHHILDEVREVSGGGIIFAGQADALLDVRASIGDYDRRLGKIQYALNNDARGIAGALAAVGPLVGDAPCLLQPADGLLDEPVPVLLDLLEQGPSDLLLLVSPNAGRGELGDWEDAAGEQRFELGGAAREDPAEDVADVALFGAGVLSRAALDSTSDAVDLATAGQHLAAHGASVRLHTVDSWHRYRGSGADLLELNRVALDRVAASVPPEVRRGNRIEGRVMIDRSAQVRSSVIVGPTVIGPGATVTDAYIGPYTSIGEGAHVKGAEIERSILSPGASVLHVGPRLVSSLVGRDTRVFRDFALPKALRLRVGDGDDIALC